MREAMNRQGCFAIISINLKLAVSAYFTLVELM